MKNDDSVGSDDSGHDSQDSQDSHDHDHGRGETLVQQYRLDASLDKVWRAISVPALREHWLPDRDLASPEPLHAVPGREIRYAMRERHPPFIESEVALRLEAAAGGGTVLTIVHAVGAPAEAANDGGPVFLCAA